MQINSNKNLAFAGKVTFNKGQIKKAYKGAVGKFQSEHGALTDFAKKNNVDIHVGGIYEKNPDGTPHLLHVRVTPEAKNSVSRFFKTSFYKFGEPVYKQETILKAAKNSTGLMNEEKAAKLAKEQANKQINDTFKTIEQETKAAKKPTNSKLLSFLKKVNPYKLTKNLKKSV